jgi:hypothetical protein
MSIRDTGKPRGMALDGPESIGHEDRTFEQDAAKLMRPIIPPKPTKKQRIAELEAANQSLTREAGKKRLVLLLDEPGKGLSVVLDKKAVEYVIEAANDYAPSYPDPILVGGEITIRWR